ncbi:MAG TPA: substrate-binding domain-containing protein, partial [Thermoplasmata archaeon]|nr:substrate-binding domain-containing protein [Thermoplasmata archaeon]
MASTTNSGTAPAGEPRIRRTGSSHTGLYAGVAVIIVVIAIVGVSWQQGWIGGNKSTASGGSCTAPASTSIKGAGSTLVYPLMYQWETTYTQGAVNYASVGSGAGILQITAKTVDFGATDAPLNVS